MSTDFNTQHPRGNPANDGQFRTVAKDHPGIDLLDDPDLEPGNIATWDVVEEGAERVLHKAQKHVAKLIEAGRWAALVDDLRTVRVVTFGDAELAEALPLGAGMQADGGTSDWSDFSNADCTNTVRVYKPRTTPLPPCTLCGKKAEPDSLEYWGSDNKGRLYCDSNNCGNDDTGMYPRDEPVDARDTAVTPWWQDR